MSALTPAAAVRSMLRAGVAGFVSKQDSVSDIVLAAQTVVRGGHWETADLAAAIAGDRARPTLSPQEERAIILYASGLPVKSVAEHMGVKPETAKEYLTRARAKYAAVGRPASTKLDLYRAAVNDGLLSDPR
jgi:DNA-binding NarL/FixJ family response regulator